jgi:hypothetical protein
MKTNSSGLAPTTAVIEAVAARESIEPLDLTEPLCKAIDPDGLNTVCCSSPVHVTFEYHGYLVTIDGDNQVDLTEIA